MVRRTSVGVTTTSAPGASLVSMVSADASSDSAVTSATSSPSGPASPVALRVPESVAAPPTVKRPTEPAASKNRDSVASGASVYPVARLASPSSCSSPPRWSRECAVIVVARRTPASRRRAPLGSTSTPPTTSVASGPRSASTPSPTRTLSAECAPSTKTWGRWTCPSISTGPLAGAQPLQACTHAKRVTLPQGRSTSVHGSPSTAASAALRSSAWASAGTSSPGYHSSAATLRPVTVTNITHAAR